MHMYKSVGKLVHDPKSLDHKRPFWLILECDDEIARYYKYLMFKERGIKLNPRSLWGTHVSVIRGEKPNSGFWGKVSKEPIEFEYDGIVKNTDKYYWIDIICPKLLEVRNYYGLPKNPYFNLHMTIGNSIT